MVCAQIRVHDPLKTGQRHLRPRVTSRGSSGQERIRRFRLDQAEVRGTHLQPTGSQQEGFHTGREGQSAEEETTRGSEDGDRGVEGQAQEGAATETDTVGNDVPEFHGATG
jgi:hypothetical protein